MIRFITAEDFVNMQFPYKPIIGKKVTPDIMMSSLKIVLFVACAVLGAATVSNASVCGRKMPDGQMYAAPTLFAYSYQTSFNPDGGLDGTISDCLQRCKNVGEECYGIHYSEPDRFCALLKDDGSDETWGVIDDACDDCYYRYHSLQY